SLCRRSISDMFRSWTGGPGMGRTGGGSSRRNGGNVLIGAMNHPGRPVIEEIEWMAAMGLDFLDLTLEPPMSASWCVDPAAIRSTLEKHKMRVVGHTAFYLPMASAFDEIREASVAEL